MMRTLVGISKVTAKKIHNGERSRFPLREEKGAG